jgi:hypothetical protein
MSHSEFEEVTVNDLAVGDKTEYGTVVKITKTAIFFCGTGRKKTDSLNIIKRYTDYRKSPPQITSLFGTAGGSEHTKKTASKLEKHEKGAKTKRLSRGGEKGDKVRELPRRRPAGQKGSWP